MISRSDFISRRIQSNLEQSGSSLIIYYTQVAGGTLDRPTGGTVGGTKTILSGLMKCFALEEPAKNVVREFAEIQVGDLICDVPPDGAFTLFSGQILSGTLNLDDLENKNIEFGWQGRIYTQKEIGGRLAVIWDAVFQDKKYHKTLLLKLSP